VASLDQGLQRLRRGNLRRCGRGLTLAATGNALAWGAKREAVALPLSLAPSYTRRMPVEGVALIPRCEECDAPWLPADPERWRAYLGCDEDLDEPADVFFYCPECADRKFRHE